VRRVVSDPRFIVSGLFLLVLFFLAVFGPMVAPFPEDRVNAEQQLKPPGGGYLLGTDEFGRDILTRIILGARLTMLVSFGSVAIAAISGTAIGLVAGYFGGRTETALMRAVDAMLSFPPFVLAIFVLTFMGPRLENLILTIGILFIPRYARVAHVVTLAAKERDYVEAARSIGARAWRIIGLAILPNVFAPLIVQISLGVGSAILIESGLSFLGLGPPPPAASWGRSIQQSARFMQLNPHVVIWPSLAISAAVLAFNIIGDSLRDSLDPRLRIM
jgi:ABC-type dipeptide/oligopeptide/nickel transport system permease subunit